MEAEEKPKPTKKIRNKKILWISSIGLVISALGIIDTIILTIAHYTTTAVLVCPTTGFINCAKVTSSSYSEIHGIPASDLGLIFFIGMFVLQLPMLWQSKKTLIRKVRLIYSITGLLTVFWFVYVELHKLNAICLYCTAVHILTFLLFVTTVIGTSIIANKEPVK